jgi:hypothetical protein
LNNPITLETGWLEDMPAIVREHFDLSLNFSHGECGALYLWASSPEFRHTGSSLIYPDSPGARPFGWRPLDETLDEAADDFSRLLSDSPSAAWLVYVDFSPNIGADESKRPRHSVKEVADIDRALEVFQDIVSRCREPVDGWGPCQWIALRVGAGVPDLPQTSVATAF